MRYIHFYGSNGYCGCDYNEYLEVEDDTPEYEIDRYSEEFAYEWAESYEYVATGWNETWESEEDRENYYEDAVSNAGWEEITKEDFEENS